MQSPRTICSAAAEAIANMEDILTEILLLVPARSVVRFKCVSKHWYSLISHPKFCHRHTLQNPNPNISAFFFPDDIEEKLFGAVRLGTHGNLSGNPFKALSGLKLKVLQSSNGLFLCVPSSRFLIFEYPRHDPIYVINPTTNQFLALSSPMGRVGYFVRYALAFVPSKSSHYKVVCLSDDHIEIYSSETRTWRVLEISFGSRNCRDKFCRCPGGRYDTMENGVYCNGIIHWMTDPSKMDINYRGGHWDREDNLLYFYDISEECMNLAGHILTFEREESFPQYHRYFGESSGHLYLIDMHRNSEVQFDVMGMATDYSGWFVRYHVELNLVNTRELGLHNSYMYVLFLGKEEDHQEHEESTSSVLFIPRYHVLLSPGYSSKLFDESRSRNKIFEISTKGSLVLSDGYYYMETLAPVM